MSSQLTLDLPAPPATADTPLVPVRMVNEWVYCPRLAFLEWVDGEWADSGLGLFAPDPGASTTRTISWPDTPKHLHTTSPSRTFF